MSSAKQTPQAHDETPAVPGWLVPLLALACGTIAANLYYAQPLVGPISQSIGISEQAAGLIVTLTQAGYAIGLLFIVPLGDLFENRKLAVSLLGLNILGLVAASQAGSAHLFLSAVFIIGITSVVTQILIPYASQLTPERERGRVVGYVMTGLMIGMMLARPFASFITDTLGWQYAFSLPAIGIAALATVLSRKLPRFKPVGGVRYGALILSLVDLVRTQPVLRRRAFYQICLFGAFSLFWTVVPLVLANRYGLSQSEIALFGLAGAGGAVAAPIGGRLADRGLGTIVTILCIAVVGLSFPFTHLAGEGTAGVLIFVLAGIVLDFGVSANVVCSQRAIFLLSPAHRSRLNALFIASFFTGGAAASAAGVYAFTHGGWFAASMVGFALPFAALVYFLTEKPADRAALMAR